MPASFIPLPFVLVIVFWVILLRYILPKFGGWSKLAEKYGTDRDPKTENVTNLRIWYCNIGGMKYKNVVRFYETNDGLLLTQMWLFKGNQPNLFIPWKAINDVEDRTILFQKRKRLNIGHPIVVSYIELWEKDFRKIADHLPEKNRYVP
ncbi:MAG: hypothetical protein R2788_13120 [Saprospiraceae bacterium]